MFSHCIQYVCHVLFAGTQSETSAGSKRKLSVTADSTDQPKKSKTNDDNSGTVSKLPPVPKDTKNSKLDSASAEAEPHKTNASGNEVAPNSKELKNFDVAGPGRNTFFMCCTFMISTLPDLFEECLAIFLKDACLDAWTRISKYPEDEREDHASEETGNVNFWELYATEGGFEDERAQAMADQFEDLKPDEAMTTDCGWWEVDLQREKPEVEDGPLLEVILGNTGGTWWMTAVRYASEENQKALDVMSSAITPFL